MSGKITTFAGFAIKSGAAVYGLDNIERSRDRVYLVLADKDLADNSREKLTALCEAKRIALAVYSGCLDDITHKPGCKVFGMTDKNLAKAVAAEITGGAAEKENWTILCGGSLIE